MDNEQNLYNGIPCGDRSFTGMNIFAKNVKSGHDALRTQFSDNTRSIGNFFSSNIPVGKIPNDRLRNSREYANDEFVEKIHEVGLKNVSNIEKEGDKIKGKVIDNLNLEL
jgi:hypothetical protein